MNTPINSTKQPQNIEVVYASNKTLEKVSKENERKANESFEPIKKRYNFWISFLLATTLIFLTAIIIMSFVWAYTSNKASTPTDKLSHAILQNVDDL